MSQKSVMKIQTPDLSHLSASDYEDVYEPAEDSFLMLDALELDLQEIRDLRPSFCLEIGTGSGILSVGLASVLKGTCHFLGTDINPKACWAAPRTALRNSVSLDVIRTKTLLGLESRLSNQIDLILCNPPYVTSESHELNQSDIQASWAGGQNNGRSLTDELISMLPKILSPSGRCYLVVEQCNKPGEVVKFCEGLGLRCDLVLKRRAGRELLFIYKIRRE